MNYSYLPLYGVLET